MTLSGGLPGRLKKYVDDCRTFPTDAEVAFRREGLRGVWKALARRTVHRVVRAGRLIIYAQSVTEAPHVAPPQGVAVEPLNDSDWPALARLLTTHDLQRFRDLHSAGRHCVIAWRGIQPVGYGWVADDLGSDVSLCSFPLPSHAAYLFDLYVVPAERSNGVGSALASARIQAAGARGYREGWRTIAPSNRSSLRTLHKTGGPRVVGELRFLKLFTRVFVRYTPAPAFWNETT